MGRQASKRKRKSIKRFRAFHLSTRCGECGTKIPPSSPHHYLCNKCWREKHKEDNMEYIDT